MFASTPAESSSSITFALPFIAASVIGGTPYRFVGFAFAPGAQQHRHELGIVGLHRPVQRRRAVHAGAFTSTLPRSCARTAL